MGTMKRKHSKEFKAKVALEAIKNERKKTTSSKEELDVNDLYKEIGKLKIENEFLKKSTNNC